MSHPRAKGRSLVAQRYTSQKLFEVIAEYRKRDNVDDQVVNRHENPILTVVLEK